KGGVKIVRAQRCLHPREDRVGVIAFARLERAAGDLAAEEAAEPVEDIALRRLALYARLDRGVGGLREPVAQLRDRRHAGGGSVEKTGRNARTFGEAGGGV